MSGIFLLVKEIITRDLRLYIGCALYINRLYHPSVWRFVRLITIWDAPRVRIQREKLHSLYM
ncbi:hypothetical protein ACE6H2_027794 [Prunus campanulata]